MERFVDTHCHLAHAKLAHQADAVLARALQAGVAAVVCAAGDLEEAKAGAELAQHNPGVYFIAGVHPHGAKDAPPDYLNQLQELADLPKNVAIGEIGLDYHYNYSPPDIQRRVFAEQLALARRLGKIAVIHTREAMDDTLAILKDSAFDAGRAVFHSCTADSAGVRRILATGATISFSGIVTFKNGSLLREAAGLVPDDRLLIETDAPWLSPEPVRKMQTNEPVNVVHVAACLASARGASPERIAELTTANALRFFEIDL